MKHYAMIFRPTRALAEEELQRRSTDIQAWVKRVTEMGITLDPRNFGETLAHLSAPDGEVISRSDPQDPALATIVYFDAPGSEQALEIARIHPGLRYGITVDVREWVSPRAAVSAQ